MKLTEIKTKTYHCFKDEDGNAHGLYQTWRDNGEILIQIQFNHGLKHGEYKFFYGDGSLKCHEWYEHGDLKLDFLDEDKYPTDEDELLIHRLTHRGEFIPR